MDVSVIFKSIMSVLNELDTHVFNSFFYLIGNFYMIIMVILYMS